MSKTLNRRFLYRRGSHRPIPNAQRKLDQRPPTLRKQRQWNTLCDCPSPEAQNKVKMLISASQGASLQHHTSKNRKSTTRLKSVHACAKFWSPRAPSKAKVTCWYRSCADTRMAPKKNSWSQHASPRILAKPLPRSTGPSPALRIKGIHLGDHRWNSG
jgi:hypothetical protein